MSFTTVADIVRKTQEYQEKLICELVEQKYHAKLAECKDIMQKADLAQKHLEQAQEQYHLIHELNVSREELNTLQSEISKQEIKLETLHKKFQKNLKIGNPVIKKCRGMLKKIRETSDHWVGSGNDYYFSQQIDQQVDELEQFLLYNNDIDD